MELKGAVGELSAKVDRLVADTKSQGDKLDAVRLRFAWLAGATAVVGFLLGLAMVVARYVLSQKAG